MSQSSILINSKIYAENSIINHGYIRMNGKKIVDIGKMDCYQPVEHERVIDLQGKMVIPGMIDIHIHGAAGADVMDASIEALTIMANALPQEGTTSFLATTMTQTDEAISNAVQNVGVFMNGHQSFGQAEMLGIHLEGPFINQVRAGAQPIQHIMEPKIRTFQKWEKLSKGTIKIVTLAPECEGGLELVQYLHQGGIVVSIGHSDATFHEVKEAVRAGATQVTHLFNQMRGLHHREPGVAGAALLLDELYAEIIADGIHVRPEIIDLAFRQKKSEKLILVTDSIRAKCLKSGTYELGGQEVIVKDGRAELQNGTLAGSVLKLSDAIKNMMIFSIDCTLIDVITMTAVNPAKQLQVFDRKGSIKVGKDADLVVLDQNYNIEMTFCRGDLAYQKEEVITNGTH